MNRLLLNTRLFKFIVVGLHVLLVSLLAVSFSKFNIGVAQISSLSPVNSLYAVAAIEWVGTIREIAHIILTILDLAVGVLLVKYGLARKHQVSQFFAVAIGSQLIFSSALSVTLFGLVVWGGVWHFASALVAAAMAGSALISFSVILIFWSSLTTLGAKQDAALPEYQDTL